MKAFCLAVTFVLIVSAAPASMLAATLAPRPSPAASPGPEAKPETAPESCCPECKMGKTAGSADTDKDGKPAAEKDQAATEKALIDLEIQWCEAEARHDLAFLEKIETDGFTFTDLTGKVTTKQDEIEEAKQGGERIDYKLSDMKAHLYGDAAILTGQTTFSPANATSAPLAYRWTDVFVRRANGEWQVAASQTTALPRTGAAAEVPGE